MKNTMWRSVRAEIIAGAEIYGKLDSKENNGLPEIKSLGAIIDFDAAIELDRARPGVTVGNWIVSEYEDVTGFCSVCTNAGDITPYCPNCGAVMYEPKTRDQYISGIVELIAGAINE